MGDALGAGIVDHLSRDDIKLSELDANDETLLKHNGGALEDFFFFFFFFYLLYLTQ